ncbi:MAG: DMT family transporter [Desulfobulbaceae bacterium]|nr:MAG: DMT family transporter [Desulfobulbaceae bacterium]
MIHSARSMGVLEWALLVLLSLLWGGSFFFGEVALSELQPFTVVLGRVGVAAVILNIMVRASGHRMPVSANAWAAFLIMGMLNNFIPFSLIFWSQTRISSSLASILNATTPVWTVLLAHVLTADERLTASRVVGVLSCLAGVVVMIGPEALNGLTVGVVARLAVLTAAISYAFAGIYGKRFSTTPPLVTAAGQLTATTVIMTPVALAADKPWLLPMPSAEVWGAVSGLAVLCTALAYLIYFRLLSTAGATNLLLVTFLIPVSAIFLGVVFLDEALSAGQTAGMGLIGLGLLTIDGRLALKQRQNRGRDKTVRPSMTKNHRI